jgi:hypothetical protein
MPHSKARPSRPRQHGGTQHSAGRQRTACNTQHATCGMHSGGESWCRAHTTVAFGRRRTVFRPQMPESWGCASALILGISKGADVGRALDGRAFDGFRAVFSAANARRLGRLPRLYERRGVGKGVGRRLGAKGNDGARQRPRPMRRAPFGQHASCRTTHTWHTTHAHAFHVRCNCQASALRRPTLWAQGGLLLCDTFPVACCGLHVMLHARIT